jgi:hypothetical protein
MSRKASPSQVVHIVQKAGWTDVGGFYCCVSCGDGERLLEGWPVRAFRDRTKAEGFRAALEREARKDNNPFLYAEEVYDLADLAEDAVIYLVELLEELGLDEPGDYTIGAWRDWWDEMSSEMTEEQATAIWDLLEEVRFYEIFETELETAGRKKQGPGGTIHVIQEANWGEGSGRVRSCSKLDEGYAGRPVRAFVDRDEARAFQGEQESAARHGKSPFAHGDLFEDVSSAEEGLFHDWLLDMGLEPPAALVGGRRDWRSWWAKSFRGSPEQAEQIWQQMDRVVFFQVVEVPLDD